MIISRTRSTYIAFACMVAAVACARPSMANCRYSDVDDAVSLQRDHTPIQIDIWITRTSSTFDTKALFEAISNLTTARVLFNVGSIDQGSSDQGQSNFADYKGDAYFILDSQMMLGSSPKYDQSLSRLKDRDLSQQSIVVDPLPSPDAQRPLFVQLDDRGSLDILVYRIEATAELVEFPKLWQSKSYVNYVLATGHNELNPQLQEMRHDIMDGCILPRWKSR